MQLENKKMIYSSFNADKTTKEKFEKARKVYEKYISFSKKAEKEKEKFNLIVKDLLKESREYFFADGAKIMKKITPRYQYQKDSIVAELGDDAIERVSEIQAKKLEQALLEKYGDEMIAEAKLKQMRVCVSETESFTFDDGKLTEKQIEYQKKQLEKQFKSGLFDQATFENLILQLETKRKI